MPLLHLAQAPQEGPTRLCPLPVSPRQLHSQGGQGQPQERRRHLRRGSSSSLFCHHLFFRLLRSHLLLRVLRLLLPRLFILHLLGKLPLFSRFLHLIPFRLTTSRKPVVKRPPSIPSCLRSRKVFSPSPLPVLPFHLRLLLLLPPSLLLLPPLNSRVLLIPLAIEELKRLKEPHRTAFRPVVSLLEGLVVWMEKASSSLAPTSFELSSHAWSGESLVRLLILFFILSSVIPILSSHCHHLILTFISNLHHHRHPHPNPRVHLHDRYRPKLIFIISLLGWYSLPVRPDSSDDEG